MKNWVLEREGQLKLFTRAGLGDGCSRSLIQSMTNSGDTILIS